MSTGTRGSVLAPPTAAQAEVRNRTLAKLAARCDRDGRPVPLLVGHLLHAAATDNA